MIEYFKNKLDKTNYHKPMLKSYYNTLRGHFINSNPEECERISLEEINFYNDVDNKNPDISLIKALCGFYLSNKEIVKAKEFLKQCLFNYKGNDAKEGKGDFSKIK